MRKRIIALGFIVALVVGAALPSTALAHEQQGIAAPRCHGAKAANNALGHGGIKKAAADHPVETGGTVQGFQDNSKAFCGTGNKG